MSGLERDSSAEEEVTERTGLMTHVMDNRSYDEEDPSEGRGGGRGGTSPQGAREARRTSPHGSSSTGASSGQVSLKFTI